VDWEEARFDGLPFWDIWHYAVQTAALTRWSWSAKALHRAIRGEGPLWSALQRYARSTGGAARRADPTPVPSDDRRTACPE
jgi:hypothetical protein